MNTLDAKIILKYHKLNLESYKPGYIRMYSIYKDGKKLSNFMNWKFICIWLEGYDNGADIENNENSKS
jgi:hypothetical protein